MARKVQARGGERRSTGEMGLWQATAIGIGGMIGAGIFSVMGVAGQVAGTAAFVSFALAGALALVCGWSFGRLGARYPSAGGPVEFLTKGFGDGIVSGALNLMLWLGYVLALAMYARAFGSYGASLLPEAWAGWAVPLLTVAVTVSFLLLNIAGAEAVGRAEVFIVAVKVVALIGFVAFAWPAADPSRLAPGEWPAVGSILAAAAIVFLSYEGFGLITNAAEDMRTPKRTLPRAISISVGLTIAIYVVVAATVLATLSPDELARASEYALARAAEPSLGELGFTAMAVTALFSTASAINATLYGGANVSLRLAERGGLPDVFRRRVWMGSPGGLLITGGLVAALGALLDVERIAMTGSAAFLIVYGAVNLAHLRLAGETGAARIPLTVGLVGCVAVLIVLLAHLYRGDFLALVALAVLVASCFTGEAAWRRGLQRHIRSRSS